MYLFCGCVMICYTMANVVSISVRPMALTVLSMSNIERLIYFSKSCSRRLLSLPEKHVPVSKRLYRYNSFASGSTKVVHYTANAGGI